jgi:uncharacterized protein
MLVVVSPAKRLAAAPAPLPPGIEPGLPRFPAQTAQLVALARALSPDDLRRLMPVSPQLAALNCDRYARFGQQPRAAALHLFAGDTYAGMEAARMKPDNWRRALGHLRILSGLYGLLAPNDLIEPHRLEMGTRLANPLGRDLYAFWGSQIAGALVADAATVGAQVILNCASVEYFHAVDRRALGLPVITPRFLDGPEGEERVMSLWAKRARGAMARFVLDHHLTDPEALRDFGVGGYRFCPHRSTQDQPVFTRQS